MARRILVMPLGKSTHHPTNTASNHCQSGGTVEWLTIDFHLWQHIWSGTTDTSTHPTSAKDHWIITWITWRAPVKSTPVIENGDTCCILIFGNSAKSGIVYGFLPYFLQVWQQRSSFFTHNDAQLVFRMTAWVLLTLATSAWERWAWTT